ncbi:Chromosome partition protein Smc [Oligella sp. MSHR50489EDL]|uniref:phage tail tape measure protein n=1 Tax=Oligella sp. MSHR50489EDL TaxID=3139409 RepID=UPI003D813614
MSRDLKLSIITQIKDRLSEPLQKIGKGTVSAVQSLNKLRDQLDELRKKETQLAGHNKLNDKLGDTTAKLNKAQREYAELSQKISQTTNPTKALQQELERKSKSVERLNLRLGEQTKKLNESSNKLSSMGIDTKNLSAEEKRLAESIELTNSKLQQQKAQVDKVNAAHRKLTEEKNKLQKAQQLASNMSVTGAVGYSVGNRALRGMGEVMAPGIAFDKGMSKVQSLTRLDKDAEGLIALREQAKQLGKTTMFTATQVAEAQSFLAMSGMEARDIKSAMPGLLDLSLAGDMAIDRSADIVSNVLTAMKIPADEMSRVSDAMVATFTRSNVNVEMIGETMKYVAGTGQQLGVDLETMLAATGLMGNAGIQAGQAGTAMRSIMSRLAAPEKMARDALDSLNIKTTDKNGNLRNFIEILDELNAKTKNMGNAKRAGIIKAIAGTEAMTAMGELLDNADKALRDSGASNFTEFLEQIRNSQGEAAKVAKTMSDNLSGDITALASAWEGVGIALFDEQNGVLRELVKNLTEFLGKVTNWIEANPKLAGTITKVTLAAGALITAGGALLMTIGAIIGPLALVKYTFASTFIKMKTGIGIAGMLSKAFKILFMSVPGLGILAAITAIIGAGILLYKNWDVVKEKMAVAWEAIKIATQTSFDWIKNIISAAIDGITYLFLNFTPLGLVIQHWDGIKAYMANLWQGVGTATQTSFDWIKNIISAAIDGITYLFLNFTPLGLVIQHWDGIKAYMANLWQGVGTATQTSFDWIKNIISAAIDGITYLFLNFTPLGLVIQHWDGIKAYMANLWQGVGTATQTSFNWIKNIISAAIEKIKYIFWNFHPLGIFIKHFDEIKTFLINLPSQFLEHGKNIAKGLANGIKSGIGSAVNAVKDMASSVVERTTNLFKMRSPSRLFAEFGQFLPEGLAIGIKRSTAIASKAAAAMAITTATAANSNMAMANPDLNTPISFDSRPSLMAMAARATQPATTPTVAPNITINVYAAAGQSAEDIAIQVKQELERIKWDEEVRKRSSYTDYGY